MSTVPKRVNVKLAKLFYKYAEEMKERQLEAQEPVEEKKEPKQYEAYPPYNFSWFIENKIAAMGWPRTVENLNYLADVGVNHLITLSPEKLPPILECEKQMNWTEIRIKEFGVPTLKQIIKFMEICERAELKGEVIGVHCRQGRGRTGTMLACYLVYFKHMAPERAILTVRLQRPGSCETYEQEKMVCHYHDCLRGTVSVPDYYMVDDKHYFDLSMKHMFDDDEEVTIQDCIDEGDIVGYIELQQDSTEITKKQLETLQLEKKRRKSKAMVINHKIYF